MARRVPDREEAAPAEVRSNPEVLGEDLARLGWMALGLVATALANDKLIHPIAQQIIPAVKADSTLGKVADTVTTFGTAYGIGEGARALLGSGIGRDMKVGGMVLGTGKGISVVVPNFSISAKYPEIGALKSPTPAPAPTNGVQAPSNVVPLPVARPAAVGVEAI